MKHNPDVLERAVTVAKPKSHSATTLREAARIMREFGWEGSEGETTVCLLQAIDRARGGKGRWENVRVPHALIVAVREAFTAANDRDKAVPKLNCRDQRIQYVTDYNDECCPDGATAIQVLERAAEIAEQK